MVQKTYTPFGLDMGTWGLGDIGFRGHGTEDIHTFTVTHGDMGDTGTWPTEITLPEEIHTFRVRHGRDMGFRGHGLGTWGTWRHAYMSHMKVKFH